MPTYEYLCLSCGKKFEVFQGMEDEPIKACLECGKEIKRLITGGCGFIVKNDTYDTHPCGETCNPESSSCSMGGQCERFEECY